MFLQGQGELVLDGKAAVEMDLRIELFLSRDQDTHIISTYTLCIKGHSDLVSGVIGTWECIDGEMVRRRSKAGRVGIVIVHRLTNRKAHDCVE